MYICAVGQPINAIVEFADFIACVRAFGDLAFTWSPARSACTALCEGATGERLFVIRPRFRALS